MSILDIIRNGYLTPLLCSDRKLIYIAGFLGCFGFSCATLFFAFDLGQVSLGVIAAFFITRVTSGNFLLMPLGLYGLQRFPKIAPNMLVGFPALAALSSFAFIQIPQGTYLYAFCGAILFSVISAGFWILHHRALSLRTTDENIGNEVSISGVIDSVGSALGLLTGGFALALGFTWAPVVFFMVFFAATFCLYLTNKKISIDIQEDNFTPLRKIKETERSISVMTAFHGVVHFTCSFSAPVWLGILGAKSAIAAALMAVNVIVDFIMSPIIGHLFHNKKQQEMKIGSALLTIGWLPFVFLQNAFLYPLSNILWQSGENFIHVGILSRFYADKSLASIAAREILLGVGRLSACIVTLPFLFFLPPLYFFILTSSVFFGIFIYINYLKK